MKDEMDGVATKEFMGLEPKKYSILNTTKTNFPESVIVIPKTKKSVK